MSPPRANMLVNQWRERFRKDPLASSVVIGFREKSDEIWQRAFELLKRESTVYRNSVDDEFTKESKSHCNEVLRTITAIAAGRTEKFGADPFEFVRTHAEWRARHHVPLLASLHAYRLAHRIYWGITRESLLQHAKHKAAMLSLTMLSDFWMEFFDCVGTVLAEAHAVEEGLIVAQGARTYGDLINDLLSGRQPIDVEAQRLWAMCGFRPGAPMAVAIVRPHPWGNGAPIDIETMLHPLVRLVDQMLPPAKFGKLVDIRNGEVTAIACSDGGAGRNLLEVLRRNRFARRSASGHAAAVGISRDAIEIARLPEALEEARLAVEFTSAAQPLKHFSDIDLAEFLIRRADSAAFRLLPEWARYFGRADDDQSHELMRTIRAFADSNLSVKQTARRVGVHTNTVYFRLNRIKRLTGVDPRTYSGTSLLMTALRLLEIGGEGRAE